MIVLPIVLSSALVAPTLNAPVADDGLLTLAALSPAVLQDEEIPADGLWHGSVNLGLSKSEGNANIQNYSLDARGVREFDVHRYTLEALWYYSRDNDRPSLTPGASALIQRRALGSAKYDQFFSEKTYFWVNGLAETNFAAAIDLRWTVGAGIGHQWRDDDQWKINTEIGLAYFDESFDAGSGITVIDGNGNTRLVTETDYLAARAAWDIWTRINENVAFGHFGEIFPSLEDSKDVYGRATTYLEAKLSERMTARLSWLVNYDNTPADAPGGGSLKRVDNLYLLNVGWTF